jgi:AcrR family transcriptional regulator
MSERKQQILQAAIGIIVNEGYANLSMRALARASGIKLGALQYHFRTWEDMLRALVAYIAEQYKRNFDSISGDQPLSIKAVVEFAVSEPSDNKLLGDNLWPQLWAMSQVHPLVSDLFDDFYAEYLAILEELLVNKGSTSPRAEALFLLSFVEGSTIFIGSGRRWQADSDAVLNKAYEFIDSVYGDNA